MSQGGEPAITRGDLIAPVRRLLGSERANVVTWQVQPIAYAAVSPADRGLFRISVQAQDREQVVPWALVLKIIRPPAGEVYPTGGARPAALPDRGYWAAEPLAYASWLLDDLPGISAPRCLGVATSPEGKVWLWLEEINDLRGGSPTAADTVPLRRLPPQSLRPPRCGRGGSDDRGRLVLGRARRGRRGARRDGGVDARLVRA
jgi:hypothetical protein